EEVEIIETGYKRGFESNTLLVVRRIKKHSIQSQDILEILKKNISNINDNEDNKGNHSTNQSIILPEKKSHKRPSEDTSKNK
ncbi:19988_t:CDS:1, partial [Dentiscutata erythropus]